MRPGSGLPVGWRGCTPAAGEPCHAHTDEAAGTAVCRTDSLTSIVRGLHGVQRVGVRRSEDANAYRPHSAAPWVMTGEPVRAGRIYAALVILTGVEVSHDVRVEITGGRALVRWPDGEQDELELPAPASGASAGSATDEGTVDGPTG